MKLLSQDDVLNYCDFVKAILMLCVIACHSCMFWVPSWITFVEPSTPNPTLVSVAKFFSSFHISCFTLISGYLYYYVKNELGKYYSFRFFVNKKIRRLLIPYFFVSIIWVIPLNDFFMNYSMFDIVRRFFLGSAPSQLWFLLMLFNVFCLFYLLEPFLNKHLLLGGGISFLFFCIGETAKYRITDYFQFFRTLDFFILFFVGYLMRRFSSKFFCDRWYGLNNFKIILFLVILNIGLYYYLCSMCFLSDYFLIKLLFKFLLACSFAGRAIAAFVFLLYLGSIFDCQKKLLYLLKKYNFRMYLFHEQIIYVVLFLFNSLMSPFFLAFSAFIISSLVSLLISVLVSKSRTLDQLL